MSDRTNRAAVRTATALALCLACATASRADSISRLTYIGQEIFPTGLQFGGTTVGGLSGIDYNPVTGRYVAISDDRSQINPARFYDVSIDLTGGKLQAGGVTFNSVTTILGANGQPLPINAIDPESIRINKQTGTLYWTSEGDANQNPALPPFVREMTAAGGFVRELAAPAKFAPTQPPSIGIRNNLAFESLTFSPDGTKLYAATENALLQDGPAASAANGTLSRVVQFDVLGGTATAEYVYPVDAVAKPPNPANAFATNGLVELLAIDDHRFLAMERSFSTGVPGTGNSIKIYIADLNGATDVSGLASLSGQSYAAMSKTLLLDLDTLGIPLDNIEGMTFGPTLPGGAPSLILVSDNNFSATQFTQFVAFRVDLPEPAAAGPLLAGGALWLLMAWRRRRA